MSATSERNTHSKTIGYLLWLFGFFGAHRFYYGRRWTGTLWFFTAGLLLIGWIIDLFLIPSMDKEADLHFQSGSKSYNFTWVLLTFLGLLGIHRFYLGKIVSGVVYLFTAGLFGLGYLYDYWTLNQQIDEYNVRESVRSYNARRQEAEPRVVHS